MKKTLFFVMLIFGITFFLSSCGQSGRLYLPEPPEKQSTVSR
ncbi:MAG TPA: lipoprotein [Gammaproteobacteria bacterium]|nr:lipoprotein [Gammaproteobacteria bacterium]